MILNRLVYLMNGSTKKYDIDDYEIIVITSVLLTELEIS
jgi:hypothetical protein